MRRLFVRVLVDQDEALSARLATLNDYRSTRWLANLLALSSDGPVWLLIVVSLLFQQHPLAWQLWWSIFLAATVTAFFKSIFRRQRPLHLGFNIAADKYAFPSGHAARAGAVAVTMTTAVSGYSLLLFSWAILVGISRVITARHYLLDVFVGLSLGLFIGLTLFLL